MTKEQLLEFIETRLPSTADAIASWLILKGIRGTHSASSCPIANYIKQETGEGFTSVDGAYIICGSTQIKTPTNIFNFLNNFDLKKQYKELESNS